MSAPKNWFDANGGAYKAYRPHYPDILAYYLKGLVQHPAHVLDVGCGSGQLTHLLAGRFATVTGIDPSAEQIANADDDERITYLASGAEDIALPDDSVDLICVAQAAHWFDLPRFYNEVRRIGKADAVLALISYGILTLDDALNARFQDFYRDEIGPFWPPERRLVDTGYADIDFPFKAVASPEITIRLDWDFRSFLGYLSTWSAVRHAREKGADAVLTRFADDLEILWGDPETRRPVSWPIAMRVGRL